MFAEALHDVDGSLLSIIEDFSRRTFFEDFFKLNLLKRVTASIIWALGIKLSSSGLGINTLSACDKATKSTLRK